MGHLISRAVVVWAVVSVLALAVFANAAQTFRGTILGTVTDASGATVPGAKVIVRNSDTGLVRETQTSEDGSYAVPELPIGTYGVTVEKTGFQTSVTTGIRVDIAAERRVDVQIKAGDVNQRIEVSGDTLGRADTISNVLGGSIESRDILALPVNGRDFQKLLYLVPGASGDPSGGMDSPGSFGLVSVNGNRGRSNNYLLDGTDMNDGYRNLPAINQGGVFGTPGTVLPIESIAEVRVLSNYEAEYGRNAGSVVTIVTKSGTNDIHGSGFWYFRDQALNARNFFNTPPNPKDEFSNHQFGASFGGPLVKDKTFWYVTYEGQREDVGVTSVNSVPDLATYRAAITSLGGNTTVCNTTIIACVNGQAPGAINPVIRNLFNLCDSNGGCSGGKNVWPTSSVSSAPAFNDADSFIVKLDHSFSPSHTLTGRYFFGSSDQSFPLGLAGGNNLPNTNTDSPIRVQLISVSHVSVFSPILVNEARFGWNLYQQDFFAQDRRVFGNPNASIRLNNGVTDPRDFGLPTIVVDGFAALGSARYSNPRGRDDTNWHFIDGVSWKLASHDLKFGYEFRRTAVDSFYDALFRGRLTFDGDVTGNALADFLAGELGDIDEDEVGFGANLIARGNTNRQARQNSHALYIQDTWRWTRQLTFNLGLRWDYFGVISEKQGHFSIYNPTQGLVLRPDLYDKDLNNFSPRISAAWDVTGKGKTVVRAGFGIFYDLFAQDFFTGQIPFNCFSCPGVAYNPIGPNPITFAAFPNVSSLAPGVAIFPAVGGDTSDVFTVDNLRTPYVYSYNLNVQRELWSGGLLQVGYVGSAGRNLFRIRDINAPSQTAIAASDIACAGANNPLGGCTFVNRNFSTPLTPPSGLANFAPFYLNQLETASNSNYNSLQMSYVQRAWHGWTQQLNYTWSHSIDDASDGQDFVPNASQPQDSANPSGNRGNSNFDTRHRFVWTGTYDLPKWEALGRFGEGWQISSVLTLQSGRPFHLNYNFTDDFSGSSQFFDRPDIVATPSYNRSDPSRFLDVSIFAIPCTLAGGNSAADCRAGTRHFGTLGRNSLIGPDFRNWDFSIVKITPITERFKLHFRADFFNFTNHPNFSNPWLPTFFAAADPNGISDGSPGLPALGRSIGLLPLTATVDVGLGNPILGGGGPRSVQFALKLVF